jgi:rubredoxin
VTQETTNRCSVCGHSFDSEEELRSHEAERHAETGGEQLGDNWGGEKRGTGGAGDGMGREHGGGVAGGQIQ